jgi:hypothetical protein
MIKSIIAFQRRGQGHEFGADSGSQKNPDTWNSNTDCSVSSTNSKFKGKRDCPAVRMSLTPQNE